jgi:hypothetical protein
VERLPRFEPQGARKIRDAVPEVQAAAAPATREMLAHLFRGEFGAPTPAAK